MGVLEVAELESDVRFWRRLSPSEMWPNKDEKWSKMDLNGDVESLRGFQPSQFSSSCLIFRPAVSIFVVGWNPAISILTQLSQFLSSCLNFRPAVSIFVWLSQFLAGCLIFHPAGSFFVQLSQLSSSCLRIQIT
ncbi:hypothetical protein V9T40_002136 [Parthenolecanium corni]|uniref:Uncharacterized protein n=1 Tax=Parthenolecanium corni TaxID=536013 RepID=A0AAN9Y5A8_9HEMI